MSRKFLCLILALGGVSAPIFGQVHNGVQTGPKLPEPGQAPLGGSSPGFVNFDDFGAPCSFLDTVAATDEFATFGVMFSGPGGNDGGAVLDECGGFGVSGHSSPNFLAFNLDAVLNDGGVPQGPETLTFSPSVDSVQINAGQSLSGTIQLECFDSGSASLGSDSLVGAAALATLSVIASGIASCELSFTGRVAVFDDLTFEQQAVPTLPSFAFPGLAVALALIGGWAARKAQRSVTA